MGYIFFLKTFPLTCTEGPVLLKICHLYRGMQFSTLIFGSGYLALIDSKIFEITVKDGTADYIHLWDNKMMFYQTGSNEVTITNASRELRIRLEVG